MLRKLQLKGLGIAAAGLAALAAALAGGAVGAMSASATLPELLWCMANASGTYSSAENCEKLVTGGTGFEWEGEPLAGETITLDIKGLKALLLSVPGNLDIECASSEGTSAISLSGTTQIFTGSTKFLSCKEVGGFNGACNSTEPAGASGEIITKELKGELVYLKAGKATPVGLLLKPASGVVFTTMSCVEGFIKETVEGSVIGEVLGPFAATLATSGKTLYAESIEKKQVWTKVEEGAEIFELMAFKEKAIEVAEVSTELLVGGTALTFFIEV